ncbi:hypothetical protein SAMN05216266_11374 [Amycolatopsis marina]|uniref:HTTM-like domain-containing protein n=1 Tax=Amycolatopsis marina TaxID=490629 RepID=A0A1I1BHF3_9PSEU|nr:hypothetical protein [Amycolatopsis marina]SFB47930.1 hypothetical protein SAMN05216266_11374 [Amycolatopsis marina]
MRLRSDSRRWNKLPKDEVDHAFRRVEQLTAVGATISALELLSTSKSLDDNGLLGWPISRTRMLSLNRGAGRHLERVLKYPEIVRVVQTRAISGLGLLAPRAGRRVRGTALAGMTSTAAALNLRSNYGLDGSDHFAFINFAVSLLEKAFPHDRRAREAALAFIAAQSCLSYFTSGAVKMTSPVWRSGDAITGIFRTRTYGDKFFYKMTKDNKIAAQGLAWMVMLAEVLFPLVLVAPKPIARLILLSGMGFHVGNARFMGLNRFFWSFVATYPAVAHFSRALGRADRGSRSAELTGGSTS